MNTDHECKGPGEQFQRAVIETIDALHAHTRNPQWTSTKWGHEFARLLVRLDDVGHIDAARMMLKISDLVDQAITEIQKLDPAAEVVGVKIVADNDDNTPPVTLQ